MLKCAKFRLFTILHFEVNEKMLKPSFSTSNTLGVKSTTTLQQVVRQTNPHKSSKARNESSGT